MFKDHFSGHAADYARYRPSYPDELFSYLASLTLAHDLAWDCATGNGQAAHGLAPYFRQVVATDASADQIRNARPHERIQYRVEPAERTSFPDASVDLVTVAQALHWFRFDAFFAEVQRVLKPGGVLAAWTYKLTDISPAVNQVVYAYYEDVVGPYWPPERRYVTEDYRTIPFPFTDIEAPSFHIEQRWTLSDLVGYFRTWSASQRYQQANGEDPIDRILPDLTVAWGNPQDEKVVRWPLALRVGRHRPEPADG